MTKLYETLSPVEKTVYKKLLDGSTYSKDDLWIICCGSAPRDIIKSLRRKGLYIHGRGRWRLDERHISGDKTEVIIATAESKAIHSSNSLKLAKRELKRLPNAFERNQKKLLELADLIKESPFSNEK